MTTISVLQNEIDEAIVVNWCTNRAALLWLRTHQHTQSKTPLKNTRRKNGPVGRIKEGEKEEKRKRGIQTGGRIAISHNQYSRMATPLRIGF
jgi:hypothetical protein